MANQFPTKTALTVVTFVALLAAYRRFAQHDKGVDPGIFLKAATLHLPHPPRPTPAPLNHIQEPQAAKKPDALPPISPYLIDDSGALDSFYAQLHQLELPPAPGPAQVVTILHYGDSPTTADLITGDVRALLQARFGDAGHGTLLTASRGPGTGIATPISATTLGTSPPLPTPIGRSSTGWAERALKAARKPAATSRSKAPGKRR